MSNAARAIESQAMKLSTRARARLAQRLISSLDREADAGAEQLWMEEGERRLAELESGKVDGIPAEKVIRKARSALR
jgi:putative addiction module component (TIGR02574 family)